VRIAIVSDIHGNWTALQSVIADLTAAGPDIVINGGDIVGNGSRPADVIDQVNALGWPGVLGNTDEMLWKGERFEELIQVAASRDPSRGSIWSEVMMDTWRDALETVGAKRIELLKQLPLRWSSGDLSVVHATPNDCWTAPHSNASNEDFMNAYDELGTALVVYAHIHQPFVRNVGSLTIANSGSVSLPYDGDPRSSYLLIEDGKPEIRRVEYDIDAEVREMRNRSCPHIDWLAAMLRSGRYVAPT
jgi:putative phosphoesterase